MNKFTKFLLIVVILLGGLCLLLNGYTKQKNDMELKIGAKLGGGELSVKEYYTLAQCILSYKDYILSGETEKAYDMLGKSYREYVTYEDYANDISNKDFESMLVKNINAITETTFEISTIISGEEEIYLIVIDRESNRFGIYPKGFIVSENTKANLKKKNLKFMISEYEVYNDRCIIRCNLENTSNKNEISINSIDLMSTDSDVSTYSGEHIKLTPGAQKEVVLEFATSYDFPKELILNWNIKNKNVEYELEI